MWCDWVQQQYDGLQCFLVYCVVLFVVVFEFGQCVYQFYYCCDCGIEVVVVIVVVIDFVDGFMGFVV